MGAVVVLEDGVSGGLRRKETCSMAMFVGLCFDVSKECQLGWTWRTLWHVLFGLATLDRSQEPCRIYLGPRVASIAAQVWPAAV